MKMVFKSWEIADILKEFVVANYGIPADAIEKEVTFSVQGDQKAYFNEATVDIKTELARPKGEGPYR